VGRRDKSSREKRWSTTFDLQGGRQNRDIMAAPSNQGDFLTKKKGKTKEKIVIASGEKKKES